jgi:hypothetical protein
MAPALLLALSLLASDPVTTPAASGAPAPAPAPTAPAPAQPGEPLPAGAPTGDYELAAWCYGAMSEYLDIYEKVKPDLRQIDKLFGSSVKNEAEPYASDMKAAHAELRVLAGAVEAAEKASAEPIAQRGVAAIKLGRSIWIPAEEKTHRELARAWLTWGLPDACDTRARQLEANAKLLGIALTYNNPETQTTTPAADAPPVAPAGAEPPAVPTPAPTAPSQPPPEGTPPPDAPTPTSPH